MNGYTAHLELKALLTEALEVLSPSRIALGAGCSLTSIEGWVRRPQIQLHSRTVNEILPRLRSWSNWLPGYLAEQDEIGELGADGLACWENRLEELKARLGTAATQYSTKQLALGCEVSERRLLLWRLGYCIDLHLDDLARALGHLRHIDAWPVEPTEEAPQGIAPAAGDTTRYEFV